MKTFYSLVYYLIHCATVYKIKNFESLLLFYDPERIFVVLKNQIKTNKNVLLLLLLLSACDGWEKIQSQLNDF